MSFEISELMVQLSDVCTPPSSTKSPSPEKEPCRSSTKAPAPKPDIICTTSSTKAAPKPDIICTTSSTKALHESVVEAELDLDAVRAQLRERLATV
jgi:hypothetical protein